ncbi:MAG: 50S ribosomal protein L9 [Chitinophagales bacterium]
MKLILKKDVEKLGYADDIVEVKNGYGRNYLIPQGFAVTANPSNIKMLNNKMKFKHRKEEAMLEDYKAIAEKLSGQVITVGAKVGTTEKIFGSVTTHHLCDSIKNQAGVEVDRRRVEILGEEIKTLGEYKAKVSLHKEVEFELDFKVVAE